MAGVCDERQKSKAAGGHALSQFTIYQDSYINATILSNRFIDEYMTDANDAQLKVYLYIVRMMSANLATSVSDIADRFNYTEKDVLRALKYWKGKGILDLDMDAEGTLTGVHLKNLCKCESTQPSVESTHAPQALVTPQTIVSSLGRQTVFEEKEDTPQVVIPPKHVYSSTQVKEFKSAHKDSDMGVDVFGLAEMYRNKPITSSDVNTIMYICNDLCFPDELFDHLLQYCTSRGKSDFRYIEKVAISWKENGVTTPEEADNLPGRYGKKVYEIMRQLGKTGNTPTDREVSYITKWTDEYGFPDDVITEACGRTVMATEKHRLEYADSILTKWKDNGVRSLKDVEALDREFESREKPKTAKKDASSAGENSSNKFNKFSQRTDYDMAELEKKLIKN